MTQTSAPAALSLPSAGYVADRPDLGHAAEGWDLADPAFYAVDPDTPCLLPALAYRSLAFADLEDDAVWTRGWIAVGFPADIPGPGDLLPFSAGHHGIHVQREPDGTVVGRFNKAQHGGCRAVPLQCRTGTQTRCSFTACGYSRDGDSLQAGPDGQPTPAMHQYLGLRPERLLPVAVAEAGPVILARLDPAPDGPEPLPAVLGDATPTFHRIEIDANWKLVLASLARCGPTGAPSIAVETHFPNLVLLSETGQGCAIILQPTALARTLCRIAIMTDGGKPAATERWLGEIDSRLAGVAAFQEGLSRPDGGLVRPPADAAALWVQGELATRILSRSVAAAAGPLYATRL
ncbi:hypothetical protein [Methylobacterium sp. J-067]|uniref:hypothetical protein n=1 Tax=Methylobacterium sp. J-067 TaxID=2836648 RepID=UPI001FB97495|nr:hypothetical protein [Methylobacterium sp. J-067]MCJ2023216.1 hypothetical protein [Methylobacterium sp. J-067]